MNRLINLCLGAASLAIIHQPLSSSAAITLWGWNFTGATGSELSVASTTTASGLESSTLSRNSLTATAMADGFAANDWSNYTMNSSAVDYYSFTLTPQSGQAYSISSVSFTANIAYSWEPTTWEIRSSIDSYANTLGTAATIASPGTPMPHSINLSGNSSFQNVSSSIQFRLYGYNGTGFGGLKSVSGADGLNVSGSVSAVPEPVSTALIAGIGLGLFALRHRFSNKQ